MIHAEIQSEDEITVNDRRPCTRMSHCPWMYTPNQQLKNNQTRCRAWRTVGNFDIELIWLRASELVAGCWLVFLCLASSQTYHWADLTVLISFTLITCNRAS